jgi:outer membrane protein OmpA-like peptidoglycan-associated protein
MLKRLAFLVVGFGLLLALAGCCNRPPTLSCAVEPSAVAAGDTATIKTNAVDPNNDTLTTTWTAAQGTISGKDGSATFDTSGLAPGTYAVTADVRDKQTQVSCTVDVVVTKRKIAPTIACQPSTSSILPDGSLTLEAKASDANNDALTYSWSVDGQSVRNNSPAFNFGAAGRSVGAHRATVTVTDTDGMTASCTFNVNVRERPNPRLSLSLALDKTEVFAGEVVNATANANDPDNDPLTYEWKVDGQGRPGTRTLKINTSGFAGGNHSVSVAVSDDRGDRQSDTKSFRVREKIVIQMNRFKPDNVAKAQLDEIAVKMQQNTQLKAVITGHTDDRGGEKGNIKAGQRRADAARAYLVKEHSIAESRIQTKSAGEGSPISDNSTAEGRKENRRVEVELFVP